MKDISLSEDQYKFVKRRFLLSLLPLMHPQHNEGA
jgi:hypothetical protein